MSIKTGILYVVATPIGNLDDICSRACRILAEVDLIAAEDTRHSRKLLNHIGVTTPMKAYHDFSESKVIIDLLAYLHEGNDLALISDAGTPLINDPGYELVCKAHDSGIPVVSIPGPSALICALSVAGLPTDRFIFEGFAPEKPLARQKQLNKLVAETRTIIFYESPHRILDFLEDARSIFGNARLAVLARELTKKFETVYRDNLANLLQLLKNDAIHCKGEFVILIHGTLIEPQTVTHEATRVLEILLSRSLSVKEATAIAAEITSAKKNDLYKLALQLRGE